MSFATFMRCAVGALCFSLAAFLPAQASADRIDAAAFAAQIRAAAGGYDEVLALLRDADGTVRHVAIDRILRLDEPGLVEGVLEASLRSEDTVLRARALLELMFRRQNLVLSLVPGDNEAASKWSAERNGQIALDLRDRFHEMKCLNISTLQGRCDSDESVHVSGETVTVKNGSYAARLTLAPDGRSLVGVIGDDRIAQPVPTRATLY